MSPQDGITEILLLDTHLLLPAILYVTVQTGSEGKVRDQCQLSLYAEEGPPLNFRLRLQRDGELDRLLRCTKYGKLPLIIVDLIVGSLYQCPTALHSGDAPLRDAVIDPD